MLIRIRFAFLATLALVLAGCATAPAGSIPRVIEVIYQHGIAIEF